MGYRYGDTVTVNVDVDVDVDLDEVLEELTDSEVEELYNDRFAKKRPPGRPIDDDWSWMRLYEKRRSLSDKEFLTVMDNVIQNVTGRIL